jgi:hypothetical protein
MTPGHPERRRVPAPVRLPQPGSTPPAPDPSADLPQTRETVRIGEVSSVSVFKTYTQEGTLTEAECIKFLRLAGWVQIGPYELRKPRWRTRGEE